MRQLVDWADLAWPLRDARQRAGCRGSYRANLADATVRVHHDKLWAGLLDPVSRPLRR